MGFFSSLFASSKGKAISLYKRGLKRAKERDLPGAIADYTAVQELEGAPGDIKAMSLFNRALCYSTTRDYEQAKADLDAVLAMPYTPDDVREAARQKITRMMRRMGQKDEGEED